MRKLIVLGLFLLSVYQISAQSSFYNGTQQILGQQKIYSTVAIAVDDINGDQKDDLILFDEGKFLKTFTQSPDGSPFNYRNHTQTSAFGEWAVITGDLNNNGIPEVVASGNENGSELLFINSNDYYITSQATPAVYSQNTNLIDLNNDGYLDLFVCNDVGENQTFLNDGTGKMIKTTLIDFKTSAEDDMSGNYSSIFTDIDSDGDLDLYIGKCRGGVTDPTDRRRVNTLYINNNDGTYTENAEALGLANGSQTWSVDAGDIDNDGDIDIIIANHDREHDLMLNDGTGHFTRFLGLPPESTSYAYQSFFADFDNNGWLDIFITEPENSYILYNNEMQFSQYSLPSGLKAFSGAVGDFNSDGYIDLYLGFASSFQVPGNQSDVVLLNEGRENNYIKVNLVGTESNRDGVGSTVRLYSDGNKQLREVIAGRSYGIMNSTVSHFGLGLSEVVDSIIVEWPSGNITKILAPTEANSSITITENGCINPDLNLSNLELCDGNPIILRLDEMYDNYVWSDGTTSDSLIIAEAGSFSVIVSKGGCETRSNTFFVTMEQEYLSDEILQADTYLGCTGEYIKLGSIAGTNYAWSNGESSRYIYVNEPALYKVTVSTNCGTYISEEVSVGFYENDTPIIIEDTVFIGESATLMLQGDDVKWYRGYYDEAIVGDGISFVTGALLNDTIIYAGETFTDNGYSENLLNPVPLNSTFDNQFVGNDTLGFKVLSPFTLSSLSVRTQSSGTRSIEIWKNGIRIKSVSSFYDIGKSEVIFNQRLEIGDYQITTNEQVNIEELGDSSPKFSYSGQFIGNDKLLDGYLKIGESSINEGVIPYFFDWKIVYGAFACEDRYPVKATVKDDVSTNEYGLSFDIYPNPSDGVINIKLESPGVAEIWDIGGKRVIQSEHLNVGVNTLNTHLNNGVYVLKLRSNNQIVSKVLIVE